MSRINKCLDEKVSIYLMYFWERNVPTSYEVTLLASVLRTHHVANILNINQRPPVLLVAPDLLLLIFLSYFGVFLPDLLIVCFDLRFIFLPF